MLDAKTRELIAIAASVVAKCQPCLDHHISEARKAGASDSDMKTAVKIARMVRKAGEDNMDSYTDEKLGAVAPAEQTPSACCCGDQCGQ